MSEHGKGRELIGVLVSAFLLLGGQMTGSAKESKRIDIFNPITGKIETLSRVYKTDSQWRKILNPEQYNVTRLKGTEKPFSGQCPVSKKGERGIYSCVCCGTALFMVDTKFESGTGWPSFWEPVSNLNIKAHADDSFGTLRTEVLCTRCDAHLGHVFDDGPAPTGKRYCINAVALKFMTVNELKKEKTEKAIFAAGCFWGVEAAFAEVEGVLNTTVGFTGGKIKNPSYEDVCTDTTAHVEAVEVEYDPQIVSYEKLLDVFWNIHDPTTPNRQGADAGSQYRSVIFYYSSLQEQAAKVSEKKLEGSGKFKRPIVTEIVPAKEFYKAEEYHQRYHQKHGLKPACHLPIK